MEQTKIQTSIQRFMYSIFTHYKNKGLDPKIAKSKMIDETLDSVYKLLDKEDDIPDHAAVISAQFFTRMINRRGHELNQRLSEKNLAGDLEGMQEISDALLQLKSTKEHLEVFISTYKGVL